MTLGFSVEGAKVFTAASQGGFRVPAGGSKSNSFTVQLVYQDIMKVIRDYAAKDYLQTVIDGTLTIPLPRITMLPGLPKSFTFRYSLSKQIPAIKPRVSVLDFSVTPPTREQIGAALVAAGKRVDAGQALGVLKNVLAGKPPGSQLIDPAEIDVPIAVSFTIEVANEAKAALSFAKLGYELFVNGERLVVGESGAVTREGSRSRVTVTNTFSSRSLSRNIRDLFTKRSGAFRLAGTAALQLPQEISRRPVPLAFEEGGSFSMQ
jgi:hypothetical protein